MPRSLGNVLDVVPGIPFVADLAAGANTGKRIHMRNYSTLGILFWKNAASAGTDSIILTLNQHTAASAGTTTQFNGITDWYYKSTAAALTGAETWTEVNQAAGSTLTLANTGGVPAANQALVYFDVDANTMDAGNQWMSISIADPGSGGTILGGLLYIPTELKIMRRPDLLANPNA
jgi:hypothetical protein